VLHGQAEIVAAFPLVVNYLSALLRNENARDHLGPGVFVLCVLPVGFRPQLSGGRRSSGGFEPVGGLITNPRRRERPHLRLVWSAAKNQSDNMRLLGLMW
jgi:hypothetical protein